MEAFKTDGVWSLKSLMLKVEGRDGVIDLLKQSTVELESFRWRVGDHGENFSRIAPFFILRKPGG